MVLSPTVSVSIYKKGISLKLPCHLARDFGDVMYSKLTFMAFYWA
jgi:hypothetical protein